MPLPNSVGTVRKIAVRWFFHPDLSLSSEKILDKKRHTDTRPIQASVHDIPQLCVAIEIHFTPLGGSRDEPVSDKFRSAQQFLLQRASVAIPGLRLRHVARGAGCP